MRIFQPLVGWGVLAAFGCSSEVPASGDSKDAALPPPGSDAAVAVTYDLAGPITPGKYDDPFVQLGKLADPGGGQGPPLETLEVRARPDGLTFLCSSTRGLRVFDATDPTKMNVLATLKSSKSELFGHCEHLAYDGDFVFMANRGTDLGKTPFLAAFGLKNGYQEAGTFTLNPPNVSFEGVAASGGKVYLAMHKDGLALLDYKNSGFTQLGTLKTGLNNAWAVAAVGTTVYVGDTYNGLVIVDAANPASPTVLGSVATGGSPQSVEVVGTTAYVATGSGGLVTVDVTDPKNPKVLAKRPTPGSAIQVAVAGGYAYLAAWNDVWIYNVTDPKSPQVVTTQRISGGGGLFSRFLGIGARSSNGKHYAFLGEWASLYSFQFFPERTAPDLYLGSDKLFFNSVQSGNTATSEVSVQNVGTNTLAIPSIAVTGNSSFTVDQSQLALAPGGQGKLKVSYLASSKKDETATLTLKSDDPGEPEITVALSGNPSGLTVGSTLPSITLTTPGNTQWSSSQTQGVLVLSYFATF